MMMVNQSVQVMSYKVRYHLMRLMHQMAMTAASAASASFAHAVVVACVKERMNPPAHLEHHPMAPMLNRRQQCLATALEPQHH